MLEFWADPQSEYHKSYTEEYQGVRLSIWARPHPLVILQSYVHLLHCFLGSSCEAQEVEVYIAHYQGLADGLDDRQPAIAEQDEWQASFFGLACRPDYCHL